MLGKKRLTQSQLAQIADIRPNTANELYHDFADRVSLDQPGRICEALECSLFDLLEYTPENRKIRRRKIVLNPFK